jgi:diguanylate cyclase (GGDEF)-like protein
MSEPAVRVLILDDNPLDAELAIMTLLADGIIVDGATAVDEATLRALEKAFVPDVILCDHSMPTLDSDDAQRLLREFYGDTPLIIVTGTLSEPLAVAALQSGAVDYVLKSNLLRLPPAVKRAVAESRKRKQLETSLHEFEEGAIHHAGRIEDLWRVANDATHRSGGAISAMMSCAAGALRPTQKFSGFLGRIDGSDVVIVAAELAYREPAPGRTTLAVGSRTPIHQTIFSRTGRPQSWHDLSQHPEMTDRIAKFGWRSAINTQFEAAGAKYSLTFASGEPTTPFSPQDIAYLDILAMSIASHLELDQLDRTLRDQEARSSEHAQRLEELWRTVNTPYDSDAELWMAMLRSAAASIWPPLGTRATLWRIAGEALVLESAAEYADTGLGAAPIPAEGSIPLDASIVAMIVAKGGGTQTWDDFQAFPGAAGFSNAASLRALIVTTFVAGRTTWALSFASGFPTTQPIGAHDRAYVEVLAAYFAHHVEQRWQFERIEYQQSHDALTGLINRSTFRSQSRAATRQSAAYAVLLIDVNGFSEVNALHGHMIGDAILVEIGSALQLCSSDGDIVGRTGGDIFAIYLARAASKEEVALRARAYSDVFLRPFSTGDPEGVSFVGRTASMGIAVAPDDGSTIESIFSRAEAALSAAKKRGHGSTVFFEEGMENEALRRAELRGELAEALAADQFTLHFQPHVDLVTGDVSGCEALIRWNHPVRGLVAPGQFIPAAEQLGLIGSIDNWVMRKVFDLAAEFGALRPDFRLYFNLSGRQAGDPNVARAFAEAARSGVPLRNIGVEITETDAMRDIEATQRVCRALRRLDVRIAIDDFGTGYSSLSSLKLLPIDLVKIDRQFISGLLTNPDDETIADTIISIAARFGFQSLAEGVEQSAEIEWLRKRECRYIQGFGICHPLALDDFKSWLATHKREEYASQTG